MRLVVVAVLAGLCAWGGLLNADDDFIPRRQNEPPGPPLSPEDAQAKMTVPEGFRVELVASEPDLINPVAMCFDERGRIWVTESVEYPRRSAGEGQDRVKVFEDTTGDGQADKMTVFAEGLNIPSGIAVGHGGVWVANAPDILFMQDTTGDGKADNIEVVVTGFGRTDTHELPNSLTWGPDGWLYGLNGVFNHSRVKQGDREFVFNCAMFRIHPQTREFQLFSEGTSNPWGIGFDHEGSAFVSACVIDHLWHIAESAYYIRQGGPYPPFTRPMRSIVRHKHQMAAYCGLTYFDSDAYPPEYRDKLYMGNIHGGCINVDAIRREGSTYFGTGEPDFLTANDVWFMPVVQKTGPDGSLYVLDWYDRYHCYQDANRDPGGIDRRHGRLWRVRYQETPRRVNFNLADESDEELIARLASPNVYDRDIAQRLLIERNSDVARPRLWDMVFGDHALKYRMHALFALVGTGTLENDEHLALLNRDESPLRAWGVRAAGNMGQVSPEVGARVRELARDSAPDVRLQVAIASGKLADFDARAALVDVASAPEPDELLKHVVWQNLRPQLAEGASEFLTHLRTSGQLDRPGVIDLLPQVVEFVVATQRDEIDTVADLLEVLAALPTGPAAGAAQSTFAEITRRVQSGELPSELRGRLAERWNQVFQALGEKPAGEVRREDILLLAASLGHTTARERLFARLQGEASDQPAEALRLFRALADNNSDQTVVVVRWALGNPRQVRPEIRGGVLAELTRLSDPKIAKLVLEHYDQLEPELKPRAVELLTSRGGWAKQLLAAVEKESIPRSVLNANQIQKLLSSSDDELVSTAKRLFGSVRTERDPAREQLIAEMRALIRSTEGDPHRGIPVYKRLCAQCHTMYGEGVEVGPDITRNGRASFEQLLSNVFDPSLVIGADYQARTIITEDGRVLTGLLVEDSPQRVVLKVQGGKQEVIPRDDIDEMVTSQLSLMPEGVEKQMTPQEIADLFAFLTLDRHPDDAEARPIPGTVLPDARETTNPREFPELVGEVAPGFALNGSGDGGVALIPEYQNRVGVLRTHPISRQAPAILSRTLELPEGRSARLRLGVAPDEQGDWQLIVRANGKVLHDSIVRRDEGRMWRDVEIDLSEFAGQQVRLELHNRANDWHFEHGYWADVSVLVD